jgi:hypothetical protein
MTVIYDHHKIVIKRYVSNRQKDAPFVLQAQKQLLETFFLDEDCPTSKYGTDT